MESDITEGLLDVETKNSARQGKVIPLPESTTPTEWATVDQSDGRVTQTVDGAEDSEDTEMLAGAIGKQESDLREQHLLAEKANR